jgi:predicted Fe-S protein YdhL (DUF1289 family)
MRDTPCQDLCDKSALICPGCGRTKEEINTVKDIVQRAVKLGTEMDYDNIDEFAEAIAAKIKKKLNKQKSSK